MGFYASLFRSLNQNISKWKVNKLNFMSATRWNTLNLMRWLEEHGWPDEDLELKEMILDTRYTRVSHP